MGENLLECRNRLRSQPGRTFASDLLVHEFMEQDGLNMAAVFFLGHDPVHQEVQLPGKSLQVGGRPSIDLAGSTVSNRQ